MNTRLFVSTRSQTAFVSRAQFSPVTRRFAPRAAALTATRDGEPLGRIWPRDLLDRLHAPLTRYHE